MAFVMRNETTTPEATMTSATFTVGQSYSTRSICDHECIYTITVVSRTNCFITASVHGAEKRMRVFAYEGQERVKPFGTYSMCPVISAAS